MAFREFSSCVLTPVAGDESSSSSVVLSSDGKWKTSSFYLDSSGRSSISLPMQMKFPSIEAMDKFLECNCFDPPPSNYKPPTKEGENFDECSNPKETSTQSSSVPADQPSPLIKSIGIEAKVTLTFGTGAARTATVEGVTILSTRIGTGEDDKNSVYFNTEIIVRVARAQDGDKIDSGDASGVKTNLEITAVYSERASNISQEVSPIEALKVFNLHGFVDSPNPQVPDRRVKEIRLNPPFALHVALTHALSISVKSINGPLMGHTFLALTMAHSNTHHQPVTITSIALHPGHSRFSAVDGPNISATGNSGNEAQAETAMNLSVRASKTQNNQVVTDLSKSVKWGYAPKSDPRLPLTLQRNEAYSTILTVDASEDTHSRVCSCPLSITAITGNKDQDRHYYVVAATEAAWTTSPAAVEPADSFRVDMSYADDANCVVGAPLTVLLDIYNLSSESRQLMLLVDNTATASTTVSTVDGNLSTPKRSMSTKTVVVSEKGGYKFGVWGLSAQSPNVFSSSPHSNYPQRDTPDEKEHDLLAVDVALLLGEIKGQSSAKAKLRVIPLKEGTLSIPNFKLVDNRTGKRYSCIHRLQAVAVAASN